MTEEASLKEHEAKSPSFFVFKDKKGKIKYFFFALVFVLGLRTLETAIHELAHGLAVVITGGHLPPNAFFISPFGGYTLWHDVPGEALWFVNMIGTLAGVVAMLSIFFTMFKRSVNPWARWTGYWGGVVIPVNSLFYWLAAPFLADAQNFDPVAFASNVGISPPWLVGVIIAFPFAIAWRNMWNGTRLIEGTLLGDPGRFHVKCLVFYYCITFGFSFMSYLNLFDQFKWF
nr:hypothetical protein [Candidatus Sigynarchaeota archaeon]